MIEERRELIRVLKEQGYVTSEDRGIFKLVKNIKKRVDLKKDMIIGITGPTGEAKSTLASIIGLLLKSNFNLEKNMLFIPNPKEVIEKFKNVDHSIIIIDEAIRGLFKQNWQNKVQQALVQLYNTERYLCNVSLLLMPNFNDFASNFRKDIIKVWIHVYKRGHAIVFFKDIDKDLEDPWHMKENIKLKKGWLKYKVIDRNMNSIIRSEMRTPCYGFEFKFPNLEEVLPEFWEKYERLKRESRDVDEEENEFEDLTTREVKYRKSLGLLINKLKDMKITYKEMSELTGMRYETMAKYSKNTLTHNNNINITNTETENLNT